MDQPVEFVDGPARSTSSTGVPYVTFVNGAIKPEGGWGHEEPVFGDVYAVALKAHTAFADGLNRYLAEQRARKVEWRIRPGLEWRRNKKPYVDPVLPLADADFVSIRARLAVVETY